MKSPFVDEAVPFGIAHQGGTDVAPGNTEAAFQHAVSLGYRHIETDVQLTADGVLVIFHDAEVTDLTGAPGTIGERTWLEVSELRIGGEHPVPRFTDIIERFPSVAFNVEPKTDAAVQPLIDLIDQRDLRSRICVGSFSDSRVGRVRQALGPEVCTSPGPKGVATVFLRAVLGSARPSPHTALQIPTSVAGLPITGRWLVERCQRQQLQVHVWTINDAPTMVRLLDNGVDAIMSDEVTTLKRVLSERGAWPQDEPAETGDGLPAASTDEDSGDAENRTD
ncbi:MAG: glycerophosphodiester phosphodiesterase family protein [Actinomycetota bacterium]